MKINTISIAALISTVVVILVITGGSLLVRHKVSTHDAHIKPSMNVNSIHFLEMCSGVKLSDEVDRELVVISVSNCLGRVRGFVDGHNTTVAMNNMVGNHIDVQLWCVDRNISSNQLLTSVLDWVDTHPLQYEDIIANAPLSDQSMMIVVKALKEEYVCPNS